MCMNEELEIQDITKNDETNEPETKKSFWKRKKKSSTEPGGILMALSLIFAFIGYGMVDSGSNNNGLSKFLFIFFAVCLLLALLIIGGIIWIFTLIF